ncbi:MAG: GIY-YIG nuclease family protein [Achromobacter sp.]|uniref:GIY-YIG nuclease family protein n=1 Tax=Achromobacter sp. TaxID=134375 RepID=UPI0012CC305E|nr:GIY-YIG nuclease family protein [Achromobacter sp.]MPS79719.1 GIY-YIG nuclease family protein [Achromobacter sp.]
MAEMNDDELLAELGLSVELPEVGSHTPREERIIAGFEEILSFVEQHGREPVNGEGRDIFERLYAVRLALLRSMPEARALLADMDTRGLLNRALVAVDADLDDDALLAELGVEAPAESDIHVLKHVKSRMEIRAAEEVANRTPCEEFDQFKPLFDEVEAGLKSGAWQSKPFGKDASIQAGDFFIVGGQFAYVAVVHEGTKTKDGRDNPRLRVIFNNGTESDLLLRSLSRSLYPDGDAPVGRRVIKVDAGPLFSQEWDDGDVQSGTIYVLRSLSQDPYIVQHRELVHKIGVTGGKVETRIANADKDATYLLAGVEVAATYKLSGINRTRLEGIFHKLFAAAQLNVTIKDRLGNDIRPREWFLVPLGVIDDAVRHIADGSITELVYDPAQARLIPA